MHAEAVDAGLLHPLVPDRIIGGLALPLDGQIDPAFHRSRRFRHQTGPPVIGIGRAGGHHQLTDAIETHRCLGHFSHLLGGLAHQRRVILQRLLNRTELAGLRSIAKADAGLQQRCGKHIATVQQSDRAIRDAICCAEPVERRFVRWSDLSQGGIARTAERHTVGRGIEVIRRRSGGVVVHGNHHRAATDLEGTVIRGPRSATASLIAIQRLRPQTLHLQFRDEATEIRHGRAPR